MKSKNIGSKNGNTKMAARWVWAMIIIREKYPVEAISDWFMARLFASKFRISYKQALRILKGEAWKGERLPVCPEHEMEMHIRHLEGAAQLTGRSLTKRTTNMTFSRMWAKAQRTWGSCFRDRYYKMQRTLLNEGLRPLRRLLKQLPQSSSSLGTSMLDDRDEQSELLEMMAEMRLSNGHA